MNGRVYDPTIGRFLSADSVVQSLGLTQSLNPYAYAGGNPVRYIDPSGHSFFDDFWQVAIPVVAVESGYGAGLFAANLGWFATGTLAQSIFVGAVGGFVGGFVGAALSTGNLTAALHAGLISAAVGGAMGAVGTLWSGADPAASWKYPPNVIAHAVVGCGGAMLSGGNCGKGALAAAVSDVAGGFVGSNSNPLSGKSLGDWGDIIQGAEVGLVGGGTAALSGGSFRDGFTTGAAGYLFNSDQHRSSDSSQPSTVPSAGSQSSDDPNAWTCKATNTEGVGYDGSSKICRYVCRADDKVIAFTHAEADTGLGASCAGVPVATTASSDARMVNRPTGPPQEFTVYTRGLRWIVTATLYGPSFAAAVQAAGRPPTH